MLKRTLHKLTSKNHTSLERAISRRFWCTSKCIDDVTYKLDRKIWKLFFSVQMEKNDCWYLFSSCVEELSNPVHFLPVQWDILVVSSDVELLHSNYLSLESTTQQLPSWWHHLRRLKLMLHHHLIPCCNISMPLAGIVFGLQHILLIKSDVPMERWEQEEKNVVIGVKEVKCLWNKSEPYPRRATHVQTSLKPPLPPTH